MTPLGEILLARIKATGPMTIADYMTECLLHPKHGYYTTRDPFGIGGDFTTAPEISQMFGELLGLGLAQSWLDQGAPAPFLLTELGPGRGTCMADVLRATRNVAGFHKAAQIHLIEASPTLRKIQRKTLAEYDLTFHDRLENLPDAPLFLIANEFFDALPIRQFIRKTGGWHERRVGIDKGALAFGAGVPCKPAALNHRLKDTIDGDLVETCPAASTISSEIGQRITSDGGAALIIDYGDWRSLGDTLQAIKAHLPDDPLANPGMADLTAHVDFEAIALAAAPAAVSKLTPQGLLLERLGISQRAGMLAKSLSGAALVSHQKAHHRLTHAAEMGTLFKAIAIHPDHTPPPAGFEP